MKRPSRVWLVCLVAAIGMSGCSSKPPSPGHLSFHPAQSAFTRTSEGTSGELHWELWSAANEAERCIAIVFPSPDETIGPEDYAFRGAPIGCGYRTLDDEPIEEIAFRRDEASQTVLVAGVTRPGVTIMQGRFLGVPIVRDGVFAFAASAGDIDAGLTFTASAEGVDWTCSVNQLRMACDESHD